MRQLIERLIPPLEASGSLRREVKRIVVIVAGANPSFDFYLRPRLGRSDQPPFSVLDLKDAPPRGPHAEILDGAFVLFCRYTSTAWLGAVEAAADRISGVGLFIDDDLGAMTADSNIPLWYRGRVIRLNLLHRRRLARVLDVLYVANSVLAKKFSTLQPRVLPPLASEEDHPGAQRHPDPDRLRIAFHSTSVHAAEHRWLRPVMSRVLESQPSISVEVLASGALGRLWRGLSSVTVLPSMNWPDYRAFSRQGGADLLLAPLLPTAANAGRAATKRIDAMRLGAALLVSNAAVYQPDTAEQQLGMCVELDADAWMDAILALSRDRPRLARLRDLNRDQVSQWQDGGALLSGLAIRTA